jgi:DNA repair exonuclease SbcCD ATPase subunit
VAPIALYPDALLAQVLTASTYPLEVAMAARWSEKNPNLKGAALEDAMQKEPWDPSVKGLTSVPQVLAMMNEKLDWTQQLGETFLAQPDDVQNAIQALRAKADAAGNLKSSKEQRVRRVAATPSPGYVGPPEYIVIEPVEPDYIYVPVYDPVVVYGAGYWPPAYVPFFWYPSWWTVGPAFGFGAALFVGPALWYQYNWGYAGYAAIQTNAALYSRFNRVNVTGGGQFQNWKFDPVHRSSVPFKNTNLQQQFGNVGARGGQGVQTGKGQFEQQRQQQMQQQQQRQPQLQQMQQQQQRQPQLQQMQPQLQQMQQQQRQQQFQQTQQQQHELQRHTKLTPTLARRAKQQERQQQRRQATQLQQQQRDQQRQQQMQQQQRRPQLQQQQRQQQMQQQQQRAQYMQQQQRRPQLQQQQRQQYMQQMQQRQRQMQPARRLPGHF